MTTTKRTRTAKAAPKKEKAAAKPAAKVAAKAVTPAPAPVKKPRARKAKTLNELLELGREVLGIKDWRPGQAEALGHILKGEDVLAVMPTGSGKSLLYQLPSLI